MSYAILGYLMIALIVVLLLTNKATPITAFVIIPPHRRVCGGVLH